MTSFPIISLLRIIAHIVARLREFYRQLEAYISLEFTRGLVQDLYSNIGRLLIDPVMFYKLQLITFYKGIRSEQQFVEMVNLSLAHRWYIGYDLDESVPDQIAAIYLEGIKRWR